MNIFIYRKKILEDAERHFTSWPYIMPYVLLYTMIISLFILSVLPTGYVSFSDLQPSFLMITVFYLSMFLPATLPYTVVFILGVLFDLIMGFPMAITALLLVSVQLIVQTQRRFLLGQPFIVLWLSFALICAAGFIIQWAVFCLFFWKVMLFQPILINASLTILLFPFLVVCFHKIRNMIVEGQQELMAHE